MGKNKLKAQFLLKGKVLGMRMENKETNFHKYIADKWIDVEVFDNYPTKEEILEAVNQSEEEIDSVHIKLVYKVEEENLSDIFEETLKGTHWDKKNVTPIENEQDYFSITSREGIDLDFSLNEENMYVYKHKKFIGKYTSDPFTIMIDNTANCTYVDLTRDELELLQVKMKEVLDAYDNLVDNHNHKEGN